MHCSSVSKSLAPGYRVGWIIPGKFLPVGETNENDAYDQQSNINTGCYGSFSKYWPV